MEDFAEKIIYKVSNHAKIRYAERLLNKSDNNEVQRFIAANEEKIKIDLNKMISYGELLYSGKQSQKDGKGKVLSVYLKDCWVLLVDTASENIVTLYKVDLGCGDDFNKQYILKMLEKLNDSKENLTNVQLEVNKESAMYQELLDEAQSQISEYNTFINNLEEICKAYKTIIDNNVVKVSQANRAVAEVVNILIGKKEF